MKDTFVPDIGLEVHVELATRSKMFCACPVVDSTYDKPNSAVCPVCTGMPGTLPVINKKAVEYALRAAIALNCSIAESSLFARKNYFYPDLPKGYQISQYEQPLAVNGSLAIKSDHGVKDIRIRRVHLEEDTGKLSHVNDGGETYSLVDFNRSGVPLLEIVSEPDLHCVEDVRAYCIELWTLLRHLGVTSGDMEKGSMRFEANLSLRPKEDKQMGTRVEIKNLNSFRAVQRAIAYQIEQQRMTLRDNKPVIQQTLGWDENLGVTHPQRSKEEADDYRYFPEPDLPPLLVEKTWIEEIRASLPELPFARAKRFVKQYLLADQIVDRLIEQKEVADFFEACMTCSRELSAKTVSNWILGEVFAWVKQQNVGFQDISLKPADFVKILQSLESGELTPNTAKKILKEALAGKVSLQSILAKEDTQRIGDEQVIQGWVKKVLEDHPTEVQAYRKGKGTLAHWFFGQVMKLAKNQADPGVVRRMLERALNELRKKS